ncbi:MAG: Stp1/IreP family PP2C-type Ser/Thr phosphatase [Eggerthellaceae bacterium]|nr:Stp1/IreP family PP2C-type Ser/Thr phosphatase [Eggerthellaceae bacterium]
MSRSYQSTRRTRKGAVTPFGSRTDVGCVREQNEDSLVVQPPLYVVADGMGGHAAGEVASEICVRTVRDNAPSHPDAEALGNAVQEANRAIINASLLGKGREGMGTTCTAAMLEKDRLVIAQVGDSRAYLLHGGQLIQLTRDHSLMADMIEAGRITAEEARYHPNRSVITRALGNDPNMVPDLYEINVEEGDRLLLCSDGLSGMLLDSKIERVMNRTADPQRCASQLVNEAIAAGGSDNITVIVVDVEGKAQATQRKTKRKARVSIFLVFLLLAAIIGGAAWGGYTYLHHTAYLSNVDGVVAVYRGVPGDVFGFSYSELVETTDINVSDLSPSAAARINENMRVESVEEAQQLIESYRSEINAKKSSASPTVAGTSATSNASASTSSTASAASDSSAGGAQS